MTKHGKRHTIPDREQAQQHYLVRPRALAGGGDLRHVIEVLRVCGWQARSQRDGTLITSSPDDTVRIAYAPTPVPGRWTVRGAAGGRQEGWTVTFGGQTPVEIIAGFTDALTRTRSAHAPNVWAPLEQQRWKTVRDPGRFTAISPDGVAWMQLYEGQAGSMWWAGARDEQGNGWYATFTTSTPTHLVQAFTTALASPEPVMRPRGTIPPSPRIRMTSVSLVPSQLRAWQQARLDAASNATRARGTAAPHPAKVKAHPRPVTTRAAARR